MAYLTIKETARAAKVSDRTVRRWIASGHLKAMRLGPTVLRIDSDDLARMARPIPTSSRNGGALL
jgi:excisionase family DNA binding protein